MMQKFDPEKHATGCLVLALFLTGAYVVALTLLIIQMAQQQQL
jgi:hypothetical protein